jgi:hypothetical protein
MFSARGVSWFDLIASSIGAAIGGLALDTMVRNNTSWAVIVPIFVVWCSFWGFLAANLDINLDKEATK